jgi:predicted nucleic acid-binding protein
MLIVADTSALLALVACDGLPLLDVLFQEIRVPLAIFRECTVTLWTRKATIKSPA